MALNRLRDAVNLLLLSWDVSSSLESATTLEHSSQTYFSSRTKLRARKAFERIYKTVPADVLEGIVVYWDKSRANGVSHLRGLKKSTDEIENRQSKVIINYSLFSIF